MEETTRRAIEVSADALKSLSIRGAVAVEEHRFDEAATLYTLANELTYSLATAIKTIATNELKQEILPDDLLEIRHTDAEKPLTEGTGNYL